MKIGIVGAGLAGLSCGIRLLQNGASVHIFEKSSIPALKVCGEYLSLEILPLIESFGIYLNYAAHPLVDHLTGYGKSEHFDLHLPLGGIGISRQTIDSAFKDRFLELGGVLSEKTNVKAITASEIQTAEGAVFTFDQVLNASGRLNPFREKPQKGRTYAAFKRHIPKGQWPSDRIHLDFHSWGYVGFNAIEGDQLCVCGIVDQTVLKAYKSLSNFENQVTNLHTDVEDYFRAPGKTAAVSNFSFYGYSPQAIHSIGDAGGNIPPLSGNGMSLAIQAGRQMAEHILFQQPFETQKTNRRITAGLALNNLAMGPLLDMGLMAFNQFPLLSQRMVSLTHGKP